MLRHTHSLGVDGLPPCAWGGTVRTLPGRRRKHAATSCSCLSFHTRSIMFTSVCAGGSLVTTVCFRFSFPLLPLFCTMREISLKVWWFAPTSLYLLRWFTSFHR